MNEVIWVRSSNYAYWGKENTPPPQHIKQFYKRVKTGPLSIEEWCEQYGIDPGEQPLPGTTEVGETPSPKVPAEPPPEDEPPSEPASEDEPPTDEDPAG